MKDLVLKEKSSFESAVQSTKTINHVASVLGIKPSVPEDLRRLTSFVHYIQDKFSEIDWTNQNDQKICRKFFKSYEPKLYTNF